MQILNNKNPPCGGLRLNTLVTITYSRAKHYHRPWSISLLSSKWDQVGQLQYNRHRNIQSGVNKFTKYLKSVPISDLR